MNCDTCKHCKKLEWAENISCMYYWEHNQEIKDVPEMFDNPKSFYSSVGFVFPYDFNPAYLTGECKEYTPL
jgi:hypothetical protein